MKTLINNQEKFIYFPFLLIPFAVLLGPAILEFTVISGSIIGAIYLKKNYKIKDNQKYIFLFFCFYFFINLSAILSYYSEYSLKTSLPYFRYFLYIFYIYYILSLNEKFLKFFFYIFSFLYLLVLADSLTQSIFGQNIFGFEPSNPSRVSGFFRDKYILGSYLTKTFPLLLSLILFYFKRANLTIIILSILTLIIVFLSLERAALISLTLFLFSSITLYKINILKKISLLIGVFLTLILIFASLSEVKQNRINYLKNINYSKFLNFFEKENIYSDKINITLINQKYSYMWGSSIKIFKDNTLIGGGPKNFRKLCNLDQYNYKYKDRNDNYINCSTHPHNFLFQILAETGIIGGIIYLIFYLFIIFDMAKVYFEKKISNKYKNIYLILSLSILINFFPFITSGNFFNNWLSATIYIPLGFLMYFKRLIKNHKNFL